MVSTSTQTELCMFPGKPHFTGAYSFSGANFQFRTYRDYVNDTGQDVAVEAGPNGPENVYIQLYKSILTINKKSDRTTTWTTRGATTSV